MGEIAYWPYIKTTSLSGSLKSDVTNFLTVNGKGETAAHCVAVADTCEKLAQQFNRDRRAVSDAALLHDISAVVHKQDMLSYAVSGNWAIDRSEEQYPFLLHQRLSVIFAKETFGVSDQHILSAIACHTTLKHAPSDYDMILFLGDKLSWDQEGRPPFYDAVSAALEKSLAYACLTYINFVLNNRMVLFPHQWLLNARDWLQGLN